MERQDVIAVLQENAEHVKRAVCGAGHGLSDDAILPLERGSGGTMRVDKVVILAGGSGSRLAEETEIRPKPLVEIGGRPILWHIMKIYSKFGLNDFVICLGYKGYMIKEYFANYDLHMSDVTFDLSSNSTIVHYRRAEPWRITLVDTGNATMTGGRIRRVRDYIGEKRFLPHIWRRSGGNRCRRSAGLSR